MTGKRDSAHMILKVSEITRQIKTIVEEKFPFVWVEGEISNVTLHSSGHHFFTLKDEKAQIRAVMFRHKTRRLPFKPENGIKVVVRGRITVYEPRGEYQVLVDFMEPKGKGGLQLAFEQTKKKLEKEGLFDPSRKKPLPFLLQKLAVITSPTGAAISDILRVIDQCFVDLEVLIIPVSVQGVEAPGTIIGALDLVNAIPEIDAVILGRGGGSMEDLWAFNDEGVARAIARCKAPVVSAVGHEIDFTISDFVADVRASTPTAAAKVVVEKKENLTATLETFEAGMEQGLHHVLEHHKNILKLIQRGLVDPQKKVSDLYLRSDDLCQRLISLFSQNTQSKRKGWAHVNELMLFLSPLEKIRIWSGEVDRQRKNLETQIRWKMENRSKVLEKSMAQLDAQSPLSILKKGYSITRTWPEMKRVGDVSTLNLQQTLNIKFYKGELLCNVEEIKEN